LPLCRGAWLTVPLSFYEALRHELRQADATRRSTLLAVLGQHRACLLVGESGSGKSALARGIGRARYRRVIWFAENTLDYYTVAQFERGMGISHPLVEALTALAGST
jgi:ABC-type microcin C transport system duplicated ATPase subunit YejF